MISTGRPSTPPLALSSSTASSAPCLLATPNSATGPDKVVAIPILRGSPEGSSAPASASVVSVPSVVLVCAESPSVVVVASSPQPVRARASTRTRASTTPTQGKRLRLMLVLDTSYIGHPPCSLFSLTTGWVRDSTTLYQLRRRASPPLGDGARCAGSFR